jgi:hypothetical protein
MTTKADFRAMVLTHLTVIDPEDTPSAEQAQRLDQWIDGARALLLERGLCWWDENDIPAAVTVPLTRYVAALSCAAFGQRGKGYEQFEVPARREIASLKPSEDRETTRVEYF